MKKTINNQIRDYKAESQLFTNRAIVAMIGIIFLMLILLVNLYYIQIEQYNKYQIRSDKNRIKIIPIAPNRGVIYDQNGVLIAGNRPTYHLEVMNGRKESLEETIRQLKGIIDIPPEAEKRFFRDKTHTHRFSAITINRELTEKEMSIFAVNQYRFPNVSMHAEFKRYYPYGSALTHVLGYVARINSRDLDRLDKQGQLSNYAATKSIGKLGIERYYEKILHGTSGYEEVEVNSQGRIVQILNTVPPTPGQDLTLTIDVKLQQYIYDMLDQRRGTVVVLDPKDNAILAMVSSPSYDPNLFVRGISSKNYAHLLNNPNHPLLNRATLGAYPPGSTIKPFVAVSALKEKVISPKTIIKDKGYWRVPNSKSRLFRDSFRRGRGKLSLKKAIQVSSDTFFYQTAYDLGINRLSSWMKAFGFGQVTGIDLFEETAAVMPSREWKRARYHAPWYIGDTISVGIGQGYWTATPLQIAQATSVLVNHGKRFQPHLMKKRLDKTNNQEFYNEVKRYDSEKFSNTVEQYWQLPLEGMRLVNLKGTTRTAFEDVLYTSGGKSGTAQVFGLKEDQVYNEDELEKHLHDHALFIGFAPFKKPKIVVATVLENAGWGRNAAPIARKIFDWKILGKVAEDENEQLPPKKQLKLRKHRKQHE